MCVFSSDIGEWRVVHVCVRVCMYVCYTYVCILAFCFHCTCVIQTMMSMLAMWTAHPSFENKVMLGTWLVQALRVEFDSTRGLAGGITKTSFDEALLESACFREFQNFYDTLARRIQFFFRKHKAKMAKLLRKRRHRKRVGTSKSHHVSPVSPVRQSQKYNAKTTREPPSAIPHDHLNKSAPPGLVNFFTHFSAAATQRRASPTSPRAKSSPHKKQGSSSKPVARKAAGVPIHRPSPGQSPITTGRTQQKIDRALHAYFPPLPVGLSESLNKPPLQSADFLQDSSSVIVPDVDGSAYDQGFNKNMDYFHDSIMSHVINAPPVHLEDSDSEDEELKFMQNRAQYNDESTLSDNNSIAFYHSHGGMSANAGNNGNRRDKHDLLLVAPSANSYGNMNTSFHTNKNPPSTINFSTAVSDMVIDEQIKRKSKKRDVMDTSHFFLDQFESHHHHHAMRIQNLWRKGIKTVVNSNRIKSLILFLKSEKKLIDSQSVKDALLDCFESGNIEIASTLFERIIDIVNTYDKKTANDYSVYYPQTVDDLALLVDILGSFVSLASLIKSGVQLFMLLLQKNSTEGNSNDLITVLGSANVCDWLMITLNRHASPYEKSPGSVPENTMALCKSIIELQVLLTGDSLDNQLRLTQKRHCKGAVSMLNVGEADKSYEILTMSLKFIAYMCKSSDAIGVLYRDAGIFRRLMTFLRNQYKATEAIVNVFGIISVLMGELDDQIFKECFGSALNFIVYVDCLVSHRQNPRCFKMICHVIYRLSRKGEDMLVNLTSEYFAMASSAILADTTSDKACTAALLLLVKKLRVRHAPLNFLLEANGSSALYAGLGNLHDKSHDNLGTSSQENLDIAGKREDSLASSASANLFASESVGLFGQKVHHHEHIEDKKDSTIQQSDSAKHINVGPKPHQPVAKFVKQNTVLSDDIAIRRIQYLALNRFTRGKQKRDLLEMRDKADILIKLIPKSNYFDQIVDSFQTSLRIGHVKLVVLTLTRILNLIEESKEMRNSSLVAKTFIKNPKILIDVSSSFLSITKIQVLLWKIILHLPFKLDIKNEMDTLAMANVSGTFFWVIRRHINDLEVLETCLSCAARLTTSSLIMQEKFGKESGLRVLVRVMSQHNDVVRPMLSATELITNICTTNVKNQERCCSVVGASHQLVQFMIKHLHNDTVVGAVSTAIMNLCGRKKNLNITILMSSRHILLYIQIIKNNLNSLPICSHMCMMLTSLTSDLGGGFNESKIHTELQQSVITVELVAILDKMACDARNANQEVLQTIIMFLVHLVLNYQSLRLKFLIDGALRVLPRFMTCPGDSNGDSSGGNHSRPNTRQTPIVEWSIPVMNAAKLAHNILFAEKSSHANNRGPSIPSSPIIHRKMMSGDDQFSSKDGRHASVV